MEGHQKSEPDCHQSIPEFGGGTAARQTIAIAPKPSIDPTARRDQNQHLARSRLELCRFGYQTHASTGSFHSRDHASHPRGKCHNRWKDAVAPGRFALSCPQVNVHEKIPTSMRGRPTRTPVRVLYRRRSSNRSYPPIRQVHRRAAEVAVRHTEYQRQHHPMVSRSVGLKSCQRSRQSRDRLAGYTVFSLDPMCSRIELALATLAGIPHA